MLSVKKTEWLATSTNKLLSTPATSEVNPRMKTEILLPPFNTKGQPYGFSFGDSNLNFSHQYSALPLRFNNETLFNNLGNTEGKNRQLSQFTYTGANAIQVDDYHGSLALSQAGKRAQFQVIDLDDIKGNVTIEQQGKSRHKNQVVLTDVDGNTTVKSTNTAGSVMLRGADLTGKVSIETATDNAAQNDILLDNLSNGAFITTTGNSNIQVKNTRKAVVVNTQGRQGDVEAYRIKLNNVQGSTNNTVRVTGQREDTAWVDLTGNTNGSDVFLQGIVGNIAVQAKNNQCDVIHVEGDAILDFAQFDDNDKVVTHLADGTTITKNITELKQLQLNATMTAKTAATILKEHFSAFESLLDADPNRKDNVAQFDELVAYTQLPTANPIIKAAADYFIKNRATTFDAMEVINDEAGNKDNYFTLDDMMKFTERS
jgi:hypothetical protein